VYDAIARIPGSRSTEEALDSGTESKIKKLLKGEVVLSLGDVENALSHMGKTTGYAVKSQVLTGGRGLGHFKENNFQGGVHVVNTRDEVSNLVPKMLGKTLVTKQTGDKGLPCNALYIVEKVGNNFY